MSLCFGMIAGVWLIIGLKIDNSVNPLTLDIAQVKITGAQNAERIRSVDASATASTLLDGTSRADRAQLNERVRALEAVVPPTAANVAEVGNLKSQYATIIDRLIQLRAQVGKQESALIEIETQFCGSDNMRNVTHAYDMRFISMLWSKVFSGDKIPTDNSFYAQIGKCQAGAVATSR